MPYVRRNAGVVDGLFRWPNAQAQEFLPDNDPEVLAYLNPPPPTNQERADRSLANQDPVVMKALRKIVDTQRAAETPPQPPLTNAQWRTWLIGVL